MPVDANLQTSLSLFLNTELSKFRYYNHTETRLNHPKSSDSTKRPSPKPSSLLAYGHISPASSGVPGAFANNAAVHLARPRLADIGRRD